MTTNNSINSPINLPAYSLTPYIVGSDNNSQYSTISSAITQAVSDGASSTTPKVIYVKPGTYSGNITLSDGIYITGQIISGNSFNDWSQVAAQIVPRPCLVSISGNVTYSQGSTSTVISAGFIGIQFTYDTAANYVFNFSDTVAGAAAFSRLWLINCTWTGSSAGLMILGSNNGGSTSGTFAVISSSSSFKTASTNVFFATDSTCTSTHVLTFSQYNGSLDGNNNIIPFAFGRFALSNNGGQALRVKFSHSSAGNISLGYNNTTSDSGSPLLTSTGSGAAFVSAVNSTFVVGNTLATIYIDLSANTNTTSAIVMNNCNTNSTPGFINLSLNTGISGQVAQVFNFQNNANNVGSNKFIQDLYYENGIKEIVFRYFNTVQTTNATITQILTFAAPIGVTYIEADIFGCSAANTDYYSVKMVNALLWDNTTATLGTSGVLGLNTTSLALSSITNTSNTININVTGLLATTYNWGCNVMFKIKN